jgi:hypothetical protein
MCWLLPATASIQYWHSSYMVVINLCNTNFIIAEIRENVHMCMSTCMHASWIFWSTSTRWNRIINNFICIISNTAVFCTTSNAACLAQPFNYKFLHVCTAIIFPSAPKGGFFLIYLGIQNYIYTTICLLIMPSYQCAWVPLPS